MFVPGLPVYRHPAVGPCGRAACPVTGWVGFRPVYSVLLYWELVLGMQSRHVALPTSAWSC